MMCECISCSECGGTGNVWFSFPGPDGGKYLGNHRSDDPMKWKRARNAEGEGYPSSTINALRLNMPAETFKPLTLPLIPQ